MMYPNKGITNLEICFAGRTRRIVKVQMLSGTFVVDENIYVFAPKRIEHADVKTQLSRKEFMGLNAGEIGKLVAIMENLYGRWAVVMRVDGRTVDCSANELVEITEDQYKFANLPNKFTYMTNIPELAMFDYDRDIAEGQTIELQMSVEESIRFEVKSVTHVIRHFTDKSKPIAIKLDIEVLNPIERTK